MAAAGGRFSSAAADAQEHVPPETVKAALKTPDVKFKDLQTVKMLSGGRLITMYPIMERLQWA